MKKRIRPFYWMALPGVALFFVFHTLPALQGVFYSFTDSRGWGSYSFIGFDNYARLATDAVVRDAYGFTFLFAITTTVLVNVISILVALALVTNIRLRSILRGVFFLPAILATLVIGYVFNYIFAHVLPDLGAALGSETLSSNILASPATAWLGVVVVGTWQECARTIVIYLAGLQTIPQEVTEATMIDGAGPWQRFWQITFPLIAPFFTINMLLTFKTSLQIFDPIVALTMGGPGTSTTSITFLIYRNAFQGGEFGYQSANAVIYFIVIAGLSLLQLTILRRREVAL